MKSSPIRVPATPSSTTPASATTGPRRYLPTTSSPVGSRATSADRLPGRGVPLPRREQVPPGQCHASTKALLAEPDVVEVGPVPGALGGVVADQLHRVGLTGRHRHLGIAPVAAVRAGRGQQGGQLTGRVVLDEPAGPPLPHLVRAPALPPHGELAPVGGDGERLAEDRVAPGGAGCTEACCPRTLVPVAGEGGRVRADPAVEPCLETAVLDSVDRGQFRLRRRRGR